MRILFISQYFPPEMGAPSARTHELCRSWVERGESVAVITGFPNHPTGIIPNEYKQHLYKMERIDGIRVIRTYVYPAANKGFFKRIIGYVSFMFSSILIGPWRTGKIDLVIATSPQFFVAIAGYIISLIRRKPYVFEVRDLWPESIVQLGQIRSKLIIRILEYLEVFLYRKAAMIVVVAESSVPIIKSKGISGDKIRIIKNGVDLELFHPQKDAPQLRQRLQMENKFVVSYVGTMGLSHALDKVLETAKLLEEQSQIHFLLVGEGAEKERLLEIREKLNLNNVTFLNQVEKQMLPYYYALSDVVLVTLRKLPLFRCVIPSKIFEIMAMAKPIIIGVDGEARQLVTEEASAGIFVEPENIDELRSAILKLYEDPLVGKKLGNNGLRFVQKSYSRDKLAELYLENLRKLAGN